MSFAAYAAHELRTPIALQRALVELALSDPHAGTDTLRAMAKEVLRSCDQQHRLVEALLDLSRSERGVTSHETVDVAAVAREALRIHDLGRFKSHVALEPAQTTGDPDLIKILVGNLISNATRHNVMGGAVDVTTRAGGQGAVLAVANSGPCIPDEELGRLFRPFERFGSRPRAGADDVGLGLAIVRSIAHAHGAIITARARPSGGLEMVVTFQACGTGRPGTCGSAPRAEGRVSGLTYINRA